MLLVLLQNGSWIRVKLNMKSNNFFGYVLWTKKHLQFTNTTFLESETRKVTMTTLIGSLDSCTWMKLSVISCTLLEILNIITSVLRLNSFGAKKLNSVRLLGFHISKFFSARWKARNLLLLRLMHAQSSKKHPKFWFNELLVALDHHPKTRPLAAYLEPDYKLVNEKYLIYLKTLRVPVKLEFDLVDESETFKEPRPQSDFGSRKDFFEYFIAETFILRGYQEELSSKAKKGINTIICAPTGSGKTYVALDIIVNHLRQKRQYHQPARVVLFVPTIPLVEQQHRRIQNKVGSEFFVTKMSGAERTLRMNRDNYQAATVLAGDICVMTPQMFVNMLSTPLRKQKLYTTDFTLMIFDECHHCASNHPYNIIMENVRKSEIRPQIVGLTASVGTGKAQVF